MVNSSTQDWTLSLNQEWTNEVEPIGHPYRSQAPSVVYNSYNSVAVHQSIRIATKRGGTEERKSKE